MGTDSEDFGLPSDMFASSRIKIENDRVMINRLSARMINANYCAHNPSKIIDHFISTQF